MKWKALISAPYMLPVINKFRDLFLKNDIEIIIPVVKERLNENELLNWIEEIDGAICGDDQFTEKVLKKARRLKVISKWGTGIDSIDKKAAEKFGIRVYNTPNAFSKPVADTVIAYILCFARNIIELNLELHHNGWHKIPGYSLEECTLGVIGVGNVGKQVIKRAQAFGMEILGNDIVEINREFIKETGLKIVSKEDIYKNADFISINCDLNPTSFHLISDTEFTQMKNSAYLINTARGSIVDEGALIRALENGRIKGAALDVFEIEPLPANSPLFKFKNVFLSPHNSNSSPRSWEFVHKNTIRNLFHGLGIENNF